MTSTQSKAEIFRELHKPGTPLVLTNIWDAGSARAVLNSGAQALATGSASVAMAQGYQDGEDLPFELLLEVARRIVDITDVPVSIDFETGFAKSLDDLARTTRQLLETGVVGINFEDQMIGEGIIRSVEDQQERICIIRETADRAGVPLFINARTDLLLKETDQTKHRTLLPEAKERCAAFQDAGASGFFVPGLTGRDLIAACAKDASLPLNVMAMDGRVDREALGKIGVARISAGPGPYRRAMAHLSEEAAAALA